MCETTRAIESHPETQRRLLEVSVIFARLLRELTQNQEESRGLAERHA